MVRTFLFLGDQCIVLFQLFREFSLMCQFYLSHHFTLFLSHQINFGSMPLGLLTFLG